MSLSNTVENEVLQDFLARHPVMYVTLSTADPGEDGSGIAEPSTGGYARRLVGDVTITGSEMTNDAAIQFPAAAADWGLLTHVAIYDALTGGTFLGYAEISATACPENTTIVIPQDTVILSMD